LRARIFIDFWNLQLNVNERTYPSYRLDWKAMPYLLVIQAEKLLKASLQYVGTHLHISYNPNTEQGKKLRNWALNVVAHFPGYYVTVHERRPKRPPTCPTCHKRVNTCPYCGDRMIGTIEKGVDTAIITDMIKLAWESAWDVGVLISSDRDYIPAVEYLTTKKLRVINVYFPPAGAQLAHACWGTIDLEPHLQKLAL
jgi:uncharacterized LabA/DUF88 family protein